jgi:signal transduction histidine kinase
MDATLAARLRELSQLAAAVIDTPLAAVTSVTDREVRVLAGVGVETGLTVPAVYSACPDVVRRNTPVVHGDLRRAKCLASSPLVTRAGMRFYAGWPLIGDGQQAIGTLCVLDRRPRRLNAAQRRALALLAQQVAALLANEGRGDLVADRLRDDFVALVSHEVRTPLAAIRGYVELLLDDLPDSPRHLRFAASIESNVDRLVRLIDQLLLTATATGGGLVLKREPVDLDALAVAAVDEIRPLADAAGVKLLHRCVGPHRELHADRSLLTQAVDNLLRNGVRFTPTGGEVELLVGGNPATLEVVDTGVGIPASERERVFDRFYRGGYAQMHAVPGAGLGLALVKAVTEAHGGRVELDSEPGTGTRVALVIAGDSFGDGPSILER